MIGGPPGIPGNPRPADFNEPERVELVIEAIPWILVTVGVVAAVVWTPATADVSTPLCKLCAAGSCGLAGVGVIWASPRVLIPKDKHIPEISENRIVLNGLDFEITALMVDNLSRVRTWCRRPGSNRHAPCGHEGF